MIKLSHNIQGLGQAVLCVLCLSHASASYATDHITGGFAFADNHCYADYQSGKSDAASRAQAQYGGKVLSVSTVKKDGQVVYKVKLLLDSGRIKFVSIRGR